MSASHGQEAVVQGIVCLLTLFLLSVSVNAEIPPDVDAECTAFLEKAKSADPNVREQAVRELVGIREAVADELKRIVADANAGLDTSNSAAKASALWLMGCWLLPQCADVWEAEKNWSRRPEFPSGETIYENDSAWLTRMSHPCKAGGAPLRPAAELVALRPNRYKADLSIAPVLKKALIDLRSREDGVFTQAERRIRWWHEATNDSLGRALLANNTTLYPDDTKVTLAFLAGELRVTRCDVFLKSLDLKDEKGQTAKYPSAFEIESPDRDYPCIVGILKSPPLSRIDEAVYRLGDKSCSDAGRERLARALMALNPETAKKKFAEYRAFMQSNPRRRENDNPEVLARLDSVKTAFEQQ